MDSLEALFTRRSVRHYTDEPVSEQDTHTLLRAAMQAPTAVNRQPWHFVVMREPAQLAALAADLPYAKMAATAPLALLVAADPALEPNIGLLALDGGAACENILLAARALGLGAVWTALYPYDDRMAAARRHAGIPAAIVPVALIPVGHPAREPKPVERFSPERVHQGVW